MRPLLLLLLLAACDDGSADAPKDAADTDTDADSDADSDTDADTDSDTDTDTDTQPVTDDFASVRPIFVDRCTPCHVGTLAPLGDFVIDEASDVVGVIDPQTGLAYVEPFDPEASYLWLKLQDRQREVGGSGNIMPATGLPERELDAVEAWILAGAKGVEGSPTDTATDPSIHHDNPLCDPVQALCTDPSCASGPAAVDHADWFNRLTESPEITWDAVPDAVRYEVALGTAPGLDDAACWTETTDTAYTFRSVWILEDAVTYHASVRAFFADGTVSAATASAGWTVDILPPDVPSALVDDRVPVDGHMSWDHPGTDAGAGFDHYEIAVGTAPYSDDAIGWTDVGPGLEATLSDLGAMPLAPQSWHWLSVRAVDAADNASQPTTSAGFITCPAGYLFVPGDDTLGSTPFCIATYEMRPEGLADGNIGFDTAYLAESRPDGTPWATVTTSEARVLCDTLGFDYQLVTNIQWQTVARSIERTDANWSGGAVGSGRVNRGHCDEDPLAPLDAVGDACAGTNNPDCLDPASADWAQKRTHWLANGAEIWDLAGNLQERVDGSTGAPSGLWMDFDSAAFTSEPGWEDYRASFAPDGAYTYVQGMGRIYGGSGNLTRGGSYDPASSGSGGSRNDEDVGIFSANHNTWYSGATEGFRCVFVPM